MYLYKHICRFASVVAKQCQGLNVKLTLSIVRYISLCLGDFIVLRYLKYAGSHCSDNIGYNLRCSNSKPL